MLQSILVLALAGVLTVGLTSCGMKGDGPMDSAGKAGGEYSLNNNGEPVQRSGTDIDQDQIGNADSYTNNNSNTQAKRSSKRTAPRQRTAYDYLNDGKYRADKDGSVRGRDSGVGRDLTQGARDMLKGAGDAVEDAGRRVTNAARDTWRDMMD